MLKKVIGYILLAIAGLNCLSIIVAANRGEQLPYPPMYYVIVVVFIVLGVTLVRGKKKEPDGH